ncbi:hypothetical protein ACFGVR_15455 [Mucilaginibacter sp. AW1-3]
MLKASALYLVIVIALVIGVLCSALIVSAYFYKQQYQQKFRYDRLERNLTSGINILLGSGEQAYRDEKVLSLFGTDDDSVRLKRIPWGVYDVGLSRAFIQKDTLCQAFAIGAAIDSSKWAALYLIDEDRPLSVSGKTMIRGDAFVPKAGVKEAYVDGQAYQGDRRLVIGTKHHSEKVLPALQADRLALLRALGTSSRRNDTILPRADSVNVSFFDPVKVINLGKRVTTLRNRKLTGNLILLSDTTVIIENTARLENILIFARSIVVKEDFHGNCQLFATDSIAVGKQCDLRYPSCLGIIRDHHDQRTQAGIRIGGNSAVNGVLFTYEKEKSQLQTLIEIADQVKINGQIYVMGLLKFNKGGEINGSVFANRFLYRSTYTTYENYLINIKLDATGLSPYYLTSPLFPVSAKKQKVLQWLE